ncbi:N-Acetylneuraminate cytidylyltransferase [Vibrio chagasii]|nr:N-Acetylneuraminate cytidylyltransferase [Vibrio chagasii]CAH6909295.1 N-Acetylneuraminate cytidylyltransferase [Vibrio chagasii]
MRIALITARGGSKGLPRKNVLNLSGLPLIGWTIKAAQEARCIDRVYVSTEDDEIARVSRELGAEVIPRPRALATDDATSESVIGHAISWLEQMSIDFGQLVLLQPTSPLRTSVHIEEALESLSTSEANCIISVFEPSHTPIKAYVQGADGFMVGLYNKKAPYMRRQDLPAAYQPNGAIYAFHKEAFQESNQIPRDKVLPYVMSELESEDIDTIDDFLKVEQILKEK